MDVPKNRLQRIFQVNKWGLPQYQTMQHITGGTTQLWISRLFYEGQTFISAPHLTKRAAESDVADVVLQHISETSKSDAHEYDGTTVLLVDVENLHTFIHHLNVNNLKIYAFVGRYHERAYDTYQLPVEKVISPSTRTDGTDTCMQVYTGMLLMQDKYQNYIIATKDHFGAALVDIIEGFEKRARLVTTPAEVNMI
jgi:hypothetical protein